MTEDDKKGGGLFTIRFALPRGKTEATCSELLNEAFDRCQEHEIKPVWISHDDVLELAPTKQDVFVMDPFEGDAFAFLSRTKCTIVGPRCLLSCLAEGRAVPELPYPMYTASMRGCVVTSTGYNKDVKARLQLRIERMGGIYANAFHEGITHLVAGVVKSAKCEVAIKRDVPIFTEEWVEKLWEIGKHENVAADDKRFLRYACPAFKGLQICVSQMARKDKEAIKKKIEAHGGTYSPVLDMELTAILITPTTSGDKYDYARKWQVPCLTPDWIFDSIDSGHALPTQAYRVDAARASTPTKETSAEGATVADKLEEVSMCSVIVKPGGKAPGMEGPDETMTRRVDESVASTASMNLTLVGGSASARLSSGNLAALVDELDLARVKKAGLFLDECKVFLSGFSEDQVARLDRVLHSAGAKRMNLITESVSHVVVGEKREEHFGLIKMLGGSAPYKVTVHWLIESMRLRRPAAEEDYLFVDLLKPSAARPRSGKKSTESSMATQREPRVKEEDHHENYEDNLLSQYKLGGANSSNSRSEDDTVQFRKPQQGGEEEGPPDAAAEEDRPPGEEGSSATTVNEGESCTQVSRFLTDKKLALAGFPEETESELSEWVTEAGGEFVFRDFDGVLDYLVTPVRAVESGFRAREVVSDYWLEDCLDAGELVPVEYYHRPITGVDLSARSCGGAVIGITNYVGRERQFVTALAEALGMVAQEIFAKKEKRGAKQSTHLVCAKPEGAKYDAALKWGLPVVTKDWLLACARDGAWVSERRFLVGESTVVTKGKPQPREDNTSEEVDVEAVSAKATASSEEGQEEQQQEEGSPGDCGGGDETEVNFKTPVSARESAGRLNLETPGEGLDLEKLRPNRVAALRESTGGDFGGNTTPSRWAAADSQPSPSQRQQHSLKRKRKEDEDLPFYLEGVKTPDTPYGAFLGGGDPTPKTRKIWKRQVDELAKFEMTEAERADMEQQVERIQKEKEQRGKSGEEERRRLREAFEEHESNFLNPDKVRKDHAAEMRRLGVTEPGTDGKSFDDLMEEKMRKSGRSWKGRNPGGARPAVYSNDNIMHGVVVYVARKLQAVQDEMNGIVASLGGEFRYQYGPEVTHVIFSSGRANDTTKEFKVAKKDGKKVVCPDWVYMSRDEGRQMETEAFPHTLNPKMSLSISISGGGSPNTRRAGARRNEEASETLTTASKHPGDTSRIKSAAKARGSKRKPALDVEEVPAAASTKTAAEAAAAAAAKQREEEEEVTADLAKLEELMGATPVPGPKRRSKRLTLTSTDTTPNKSAAELRQAASCIDSQHSQAPTGNSQVIQWKDPKEEAERKILQEKLAAEAQAMAGGGAADEGRQQKTFQSMEIPDNLTAMMEEDEEGKENSQGDASRDADASGAKAGSIKTFRRFMVSSVPEEDRKKFAAFLIGQGVEFSDLAMCDPTATHIVAPKLSRSEKMLGSIASGKWVLHSSYMDACMAAGRVLPEAGYEWGDPANCFIGSATGMSDLERSLATAARRWRLRGIGRGAFSGFRAIIHTTTSRQEAFGRLVELGGGEVLTGVRVPFTDAGGATHVFVESARMPGVKLDYRSLARQGVAVVSPLYINEFLISQPAPKVDKFIVEDYKQAWANRART